ncbi:hypothetical protein [Cryptosporangium sp. NPDC051539]|uniref:hypothetical protein n=1 Tax=Cryptosporangium sp. NPDC051539 TaxID=3363962 RepID=UPI00379704E5
MRGRSAGSAAGGVVAAVGLAFALAGGVFGVPGTAGSVFVADDGGAEVAVLSGGTGGSAPGSSGRPAGSSWTEFPGVPSVPSAVLNGTGKVAVNMEVATGADPMSGTGDTGLLPGSSGN